MTRMRCALLLLTAALGCGAPAPGRCQAQTIGGRVLVCSADGAVQGEAPQAWVVLCRDGRLLKRQDKLQPQGRFELAKEDDGRSFDVVVGGPGMAPTVLHGLAVDAGQSLVVNVTLQRVADLLQTGVAGRKTAERRLAEALDTLPADSDEARSLRDAVDRLGRHPLLGIVVPAYFYPGGHTAKEWDELFWAAAELRDDAALCVVVNVQNGPGNPQQPDANYVELIARLAKAGVIVAGYVNSDYGKRGLNDIQRDVGAWVKSYRGVGALFFDQVSTGKNEIAHYHKICEFSRKALKGSKAPLLIGNAGAHCDEGYADEGGFDMLCVAENRWGERPIERPRWLTPQTRARAGAILYGVRDRKESAAAFERITAEGLSFLFLTDQSGQGNDVLWTRLPDHREVWRPLVQQVKDWNQSARSAR